MHLNINIPTYISAVLTIIVNKAEEAAPGTKMWEWWVRGSKGQEWGFLEKGKWALSHQLGDRVWCILGFENNIKMINRENGGFC